MLDVEPNWGPITSRDLDIIRTILRKDIGWIERRMLKLVTEEGVARESGQFRGWEGRRDEEVEVLRHVEQEMKEREEGDG